MHVGRAGVHAGVEQAHHGLLYPAGGVQAEHGKADDPGLTGAKAGGLDIDNGPTPVRVTGGPSPDVAHTDEDDMSDRHLRRRCASCRQLN
ncbi:hypothetical protein LRC537489_48890 [Mycobacterium riyadhense]